MGLKVRLWWGLKYPHHNERRVTEMKNTKHECIIGFINNFKKRDVVTLDGLKAHIIANRFAFNHSNRRSYYTLSDYCDKRKSVDMIRFDYCPICGRKIDWEAIKRTDQCD